MGHFGWALLVAVAGAYFVLWAHVTVIDDHGRRIQAIESAQAK